MSDAILCAYPGYDVIAPVDSNQEGMIVIRHGADFPDLVRLDSGFVTLSNGSRIQVTMNDSDLDGATDSFSFETWQFQGHRHVHSTDRNLDGQPDFRSTELSDGLNRHEAWVQDAWHEVHLSDGARLAAEPGTRLEVGPDDSQ